MADLKGYEFGGEYDSALNEPRPRYLVPADTLVGIESARVIGIVSETDFFGGLVPFGFMATKTITHPLVHGMAAAPEGWMENFAQSVKNVVLFGFTAFTTKDARLAGERVLERGNARLKPGVGAGGKGQQVVSTLHEFQRAIDGIDTKELANYGISIEENLHDVTTYSVGTVRFHEMQIAYCGRQLVTRNHHNKSVYGGSDLLVVIGDFDELLRFNLTAEFRSAVKQARVYDFAASTHIPGFLASRRNYDIAVGLDCQGGKRGGVLEQSWRIGGASPAEVAALEAFSEDPTLKCVRASCPEIYNASHELPPHACVSFCGEDTEVGPLTKYSVVEPYGYTR